MAEERTETKEAPAGKAKFGAKKKVLVVITSRALFDLEKAHAIFTGADGDKGEESPEPWISYRVWKYEKYLEKHYGQEGQHLKEGTGFPLVKGLLRLNELAEEKGQTPPIEIILTSRCRDHIGHIIKKSINFHGLKIKRFCFLGGGSRARFLSYWSSQFPEHELLFLSADKEDVKKALTETRYAAAIVQPCRSLQNRTMTIAFDGDAVLFDDSSDKRVAKDGLDKYHQDEKGMRLDTLEDGPFARVLRALYEIRLEIRPTAEELSFAIVTARSDFAVDRVGATFADWGVQFDQGYYLGGKDKAPALELVNPCMYFDDSLKYVVSAAKATPSAHVPFGFNNAEAEKKAAQEASLASAAGPSASSEANLSSTPAPTPVVAPASPLPAPAASAPAPEVLEVSAHVDELLN